MANYGGGGAGRTGPYWRRQLGTTLPGERSGPELQLINRLRAKAGLPPVGGPVGENTRTAQAVAPAPLQRSPLSGHYADDPTAPTVAPSGPPNDVHLDPLENPGGGGVGGFEGPLPNPQLGQQQGLRERLLATLQHGQQGTSAEALRRFMMQRQQRQAVPGPARPILPPRQPLRRAIQQPY